MSALTDITMAWEAWSSAIEGRLTALESAKLVQAPSPATVPVAAPAPAPATRPALLGMYLSSTTPTMTQSLGYKPDFTINNSFQDSGLGKGVSGLAGINGYPVIVALDLGAIHYNSTAADYQNAAAGKYDAYYEATVKSLVPYAASIYAVRIEPEFNLHGEMVNGVWVQYYVEADPVIFAAAWNAMAKFVRQYLPNAKIIFNPNVQNGPDVRQYFPGKQFCDALGIDAYMQPQYSTTFAALAAATPNGLDELEAFAKASGIPPIMCEWSDLYPGADQLTAMAVRINANYAAHAYWNSNDDLGVGSGGNVSPILVGSKLAAFKAAFGAPTYGGTFWTPKATTALPGY